MFVAIQRENVVFRSVDIGRVEFVRETVSTVRANRDTASRAFVDSFARVDRVVVDDDDDVQVVGDFNGVDDIIIHGRELLWW